MMRIRAIVLFLTLSDESVEGEATRHSRYIVSKSNLGHWRWS